MDMNKILKQKKNIIDKLRSNTPDYIMNNLNKNSFSNQKGSLMANTNNNKSIKKPNSPNENKTQSQQSQPPKKECGGCRRKRKNG